jgi:4-amino-4-deoxy-L-arabinose transferase-like glycosyltransferase
MSDEHNPSEPEVSEDATPTQEHDEQHDAVAVDAPARTFSSLAWFDDANKQVWRDRALVLLLAALVYLPLLGSFGLWDPWETHYGEVGRQILERNDWISTWWGGHWTDAGNSSEGAYFFSKPILLMWLMAMGMQVFGFGEFGIRIGVCSIAMLGLILVYSMGREVFSRRVGFLMAGVLGTSPFFFMLSRQAQTDMPFVGLMTIGMCFFMMAMFGAHREQAPDRFSYVLTGGWIGLVCIPQVILVLVGLARWRGTASAALATLSKQPLNAVILGGVLLGLSLVVLGVGIKRCHKPGGWSLGRWFGLSQAVVWGPLLVCLIAALATGGKPQVDVNGWFVWGPVQAAIYMSCLQLALFWAINRPDITRRQVHLFGFYVFVGLATLAKGLLGFMLPGAILFFYILFTREWRMLKKVELGRGILVFMAVAFPWYAGMLIRHTTGFWNRFFVHDHFKRLASGVHQVDEGSFEHFARWLGYGLFPWVAFVPAALARLIESAGSTEPRSDRSRATWMLAIWAVVAFTLFTLSSTKFHHYIFPVLPALSLLVALALDEALDMKERARWPLYVLGTGLMGLVAWDIIDDPQMMKNLFTYKYDRTWHNAGWDSTFRWMAFGVSVPAGIGAVLMWFRVERLRQVSVACVFLASTAFAYVCLDYYMPRLSLVWSQKGLWDAYYEQCERIDGPPGSHKFKRYCREPVIAYKLNWRGETFYTQNEVIPIRDDDDFTHFFTQQKDEPFYAIMEMPRYRGEFQRKMPADKKAKVCLTHNRDAKFVLVKYPCAPDDPARVPEKPPGKK